MKKSLLLLCVAFIGFSQFAFTQDTLKTSSHSWTTEVNVNPLQGQISLNNAVNQIKVRYFTTDQLAYRIAFSASNIKKEDGQKSVYGSNPVDNNDLKKATSVGLNLGFEKHFTGTRRLSPYIGCELALGLKKTSETVDSKTSTTEIKGAWQSVNGGYITYTNSDRGFKSLGVNAVAGFDFYVAKHFYFGYEMLFGLNYIEYDDMVVTVTPKTGQTPGTNSYPELTGNELNIGPRIINGIRLGFTF
jgi:hypothetical protein